MNRSARPWLLGSAAAAAVVIAALAGWALFGPKAPPAVPDAQASPTAGRIAQHARAVAGHGAGIRYVGMAPSLPQPREGYQVTFVTEDPALARARDDAANAARQAAWQQRFCTGQLQQEMAARQVNVVSGRLVDGSGRTQHVADCRGDGQVQTGPGGPLL
ncbi:hypothetical protein [Massilia sp. METH4]|uniref:hypothetical protein n=1 Tax=Massilia sp. METH4 TaxID=3123041 RepID=UPI0030D051AB